MECNPVSHPSSLLSRIDDSTRLAGHNRLALLLFELGDEVLYGINVFKVREVLTTPEIRPMPKSHPVVAGVIRVREQNVMVLKLAAALGLPGHLPATTSILTEFNRTTQGLLVSRVDRIIHKSVEEVLPPPNLDGQRDGFLTAVTRHEGRIVEIIDVEHVLSLVSGPAPELSESVVQAVPHAAIANKTVLVADDSRTARAQIVRTLDALGLESLVVNDGRAALRALQAAAESGPATEVFAMVISDIEMPDMDGYHLTSEIRKDPRLRDLPVVLHTSLSGMFNAALVRRVGADRFVPKFHPDDLAKAVTQTLSVLHATDGTALAPDGTQS